METFALGSAEEELAIFAPGSKFKGLHLSHFRPDCRINKQNCDRKCLWQL